MTSLKKRIILFGGITLILLILIIIFVFRPKQPGTSVTPTPIPSESINVGGSSNELLVSNQTIFFPFLTDAGNLIGLTEKGTIFTEINPETNASRQLFPDPIDVVPSRIVYAPDGSGAIIEHHGVGGGDESQTIYYDFQSSKKVVLSNKIFAVNWLPNSQQIVYLFRTNDTKTVVAQANPDGTHFSTIIEQVTQDDPSLTLDPAGAKGIVFSKYHGEEGSQLLDFRFTQVNLETKRTEDLPFSSVTSPTWSPDGTHLAYLKISPTDRITYLTIANLADKNEVTTQIATIPTKFTWRTDQLLVVASPTPAHPDDTPNGFSLASSDTVWQVATDGTAIKVEIAGTPPLENLLIRTKTDELFFTRLYTMKKIKLPNG